MTYLVPSYTKGSTPSKGGGPKGVDWQTVNSQIVWMLQNDNRYVAYSIDNGVRYYLSYNGYLTNHFIDVCVDDNGCDVITGNIRDLLDNQVTYTYLPLNYMRMPVMDMCENHIVYVMQDEVFVPISITYIQHNPHDYLEVECVNLYDGCTVSYENIN